ncbi:MAG TPA: hypothetical protein VIP48_05555 [Streptosporangiaceae bacterium]
MGIGIYIAYLLLSMGLTIAVGVALSRSGRVFLTEVLGGNRALADAVNRLLIVGFYLLTLGFIALVMRPPGAITSAAQAAQVLSIKIGEVLLVLGAAHVAGVTVVRRFGRRAAAQGSASPAAPASTAAPASPAAPVSPMPASAAPPGVGGPVPPASPVPRPRARQDVH